LNLPVAPQEKLGPDFLLQVQNGLADGRLGHMEAARGFAIVQVSGNSGKIAEVSEFHSWNSL